MTMHIDETVEKEVAYLLDHNSPNMGNALGLTYLFFSKNKTKASMPVNENTVQPFGLLHGGASVALAETLASIGAWLNVDDPDKIAVGIEINANHIRSVPKGKSVIGTAIPIRIGKNIQVWETKIHTESDKLVCVSRCTLAVVDSRES